jgi:hypothetical protein
MLTINKTYCINSDDDRSATNIRLNKENGIYNFSITNFSGDKIDLQLNETMASEFFTSLKELGNFV